MGHERVKTEEEIKILREGGKRLAEIISRVASTVRAGVSTGGLDKLAFQIVEKFGDRPSFLNYKPRGVGRPFPASICASVNDEIVHGVPNENPRILKEGDIIGIDIGLIHKKLFTDSAVTVGIGKISENAQKLLRVAEEALYQGIEAVKDGKTVGDIGFAIESYVKPFNFGIVRNLAGHGVGYAVHEEPIIPNYGKPGHGEELKAGMVIAIEPMINEGGDEIFLANNGQTYKTADGSLSAHFEHTVLVKADGYEILTEL